MSSSALFDTYLELSLSEDPRAPALLEQWHTLDIGGAACSEAFYEHVIDVGSMLLEAREREAVDTLAHIRVVKRVCLETPPSSPLKRESDEEMEALHFAAMRE